MTTEELKSLLFARKDRHEIGKRITEKYLKTIGNLQYRNGRFRNRIPFTKKRPAIAS